MSKKAVTYAQALLNLDGAAIKVDGVSGPATRGAMAKAAPSTLAEMEQTLKGRGHARVFASLLPVQAELVSTKGLPPEPIKQVIDKWADVFGVNRNLAYTIAYNESKYNLKARSGSGASGLFQITAPAIADVREKPATRRYYFSGDRFDLEYNTMVGVGYIRVCADYAKINPKTANPRDWYTIYGYYNLGIGSMRAIARKDYANPVLLSALATQAAPLQRGGPANYIDNVQKWMVLV